MAANVVTWSDMSNEASTTATELEAAQMEELIFLRNAFSNSSATALQRGGQGDWIRLREFLQILQPVGKALLQFSEVQHYIQRIAEHVTNNQETLGELKLIELLAEVFAGVEYDKSCINYPSGDTKMRSPSQKKLHRTAERSVIDNNTNNNGKGKTFNVRWQDIEEKMKPKELNLLDIQRYLPRVLSEIAKHEAVWKDALGLTLVAANTEIPFEVQKEVRVESTSEKSTVVISLEQSHFPAASKQPKNGFAVVQSLVRDRAIDITNIWYLNLAETRHYSPYDLKVVSRKKINPEHYVISVFGALHIKPGGESELRSLGKWYREATVYKTIKKIPFFSNYLIYKTFMFWKRNIKFIKFLRIQKQLKEKHLLEVPSMMAAILKVRSLLSEMEQVDLFPTDVEKCYTLEQFNHVVYVILKNAKKYTEKLYSYCQKNLSTVESDCFEFLEYCEFQLAQKTDNIKESMTLARQRRNLQLKNFGLAKFVVEQKLPNFVCLVEEILHQFMLALISEKFSRFVHEVMYKQSGERNGLFCADFQFDGETNLLVLSPRPQSFLRSLRLSFDNVPAVLSEVCVPLSLQMKHETVDTIMSKEVDGNKRLTADELRILLNCGAKEAHETLKQGNDLDGRMQLSEHEQVQPLLHVDQENQDSDASGASREEALQERLGANKVVQDCTSLLNSLMAAAFKEVETFAEEHKWLAAIHSFVITWDKETLQSWKGQTAFKIEKQVQQIKTWIDQVRRVEKSIETANGILFVDGSEIQEVLVPGLKKILKGMMDIIANHCLLSSEQLITELYEISKGLSTKTSTIQEFTALYLRLKDCKEKSASLQNRVEYVKSIYEVVRICYRQLNSDEEDTEERLNTEWNSFLYFMQDANNYVNSLTPQMLENLEKSISALEYEAMEITEKVTSGKFLDADENPKDILPELKELHLRFAEIKDQLLRLVKCEDIIKDEPHDLTSLSSMQARIVARHELWRYCEATTYTINDWMQTQFTKLQTKKVVEKVKKWREAVVKLKRDIPTNDEVLCSWIEKIEDFGIDLPLLLELSSVSLKVRHWRWLFACLGQVYDQSYHYLVNDLVSFGLRDHSQQVISICDSAAAEHALESHLKKLTKKWEEEEFRLMKYFQVNKQSKKAKETEKNKNASRDMFILTGVNELQSHVEDNLVTLQSMLVSPHLAEMSNLAETWSGYLHQLKEILDMWISCQQKWLYLGKIFNHGALSMNISQQLEDFGDVDAKFKKHMAAVLKDPKVLSVLEKKRSDKGYRELQGDTLRELFVDVIAKEEKIIKCLDSYLDRIRAAFPRLYFLSDSEMLELLAISRDPKALVPFVNKCFPGIVNLKFTLPQALSSTVRTQLDATLNAHKLEVTCFYGQCGEEMNLAKTIQPTDRVEDWLCSIEYAMKSVLWRKMAACFEERFLNTPSITKLLTSIGILQKGDDANTEIQRPSSARKRFLLDESENAYWFIVHPFQCVLAAEEVIWTTNMTKALDPKGFQSISDVRTLVDDAISQYSAALQSNLVPEPEKSLSKKVMMLIQALLVRALYHQEITKDLDKPGVDESSFEWLQCLKYQIEISHDKRRRIYDRHRKAGLIIGASNTAKFGMLRTNQMELSLPYGYEYQGPASRLAITPLTDRALLNLMTAMKLHYTGGLFGPAQTGKTETMHEVSKMLGSNLVTFTCNPSLSISKILHFIAGAIQSGSLICLENITLLPNAILSVLGQHLDCTRQALGSLERRAFSQFETRDADVAKNLSEQNLVRRKRGITVISLHTMVVRDTQVDIEFKANEEVRPLRDRSHSVSEIMDITNPRKQPDTKRSELKVVRSEMKIHGELNDGNSYQKIKPLGNVMLGGNLMEASPLFGCFMTIKTTKNHYESMPDNLRNTMRLVSTVLPDYEILIETFLLSNGFKNYHKLAKKLACFRELLRDQFLGDAVYTLSLVQIKAIVIFGGKGCRQMKSEKLYASTPDPEKLSSQVVLEGKIEESCLGQAIYTLMFAAINPLDISNFIRLLTVSFPACKDSIGENKHADEMLLSSVRQQIESDSLLDKDEFVNKVMQLHETMFLNRSVILLGAPGSGKSSCYQTLCRALCQFYSAWTQAVKIRRDKMNNKKRDVAEENTSFSKVNLSTIYHKAMTNEELFGGFDKASQNWSDGLLPKFLRTASKLQHDSKEDERTCDTIQFWFVFDGPLDRKLTDPLESLLDNKNELCLMNGERIKPPDSVRFLFETTNLADSSPAIISRSAIVNFEKGLLDWRCLHCSWTKSARTKFDISKTGLKVVESMLEHIDEPLAEFLANDAEPILTKKYHTSTTPGTIASCLPEISSILQLLAAILERCRDSAEKRFRSESISILSDTGSVHSRSKGVRENEEIKFISNAFAYAFVWAVGGRLHERCYSKFDMFSRQLFATCPYSVIFPCTVFDATFDYMGGELTRWQGNTADVPKAMPSQNYVVCTEIEKYFTITDLLLSSGSHVLIAGEQGVGKTAFVKNLLQPRQKLQQILVSQGLTSQYFQQKIQRYVRENQSRFRSSHVKPPPQQQKGSGTNKSLFFIDDVSMAECESHCKNAQPTLEVLRQMMSEGGVYHQERQYFQHLPNLQFLAACVPPDGYGKGGPNRELSPRLTRRMNIINMMPLSDDSLNTIYTSVYKAWLEEFPAYSLTHIDPLAKALAYASVDMYNKIKEKLIASPTNPQYVFSHHGLARIAKGVFIYSPKSRLRARKSGQGFAKGDLSVNQSMPDLQANNSMVVGMPDPSSSVIDLQAYLNKHNIDRTPASVSPLIRIIIRLWCHEICRSFHDRITNTEDKTWFSTALHKTVVVKFCGEKPLANKQGILSREASTTDKKNIKNRVKFKDIESTRQADYQGPLISFKHLMGDDQAFASITFSKHLFIYGTRGIEGAGEHEKGYVECFDHHLEEALRKSLNLINKSEDERMDLVLYKEALHHAVRISRILSMPGGHALLVSLNGHGRANIVKLVAKLANIKMMTVSRSALTNQTKFRSILKEVCYVAGLQGRPTILYIPEGLNKEGMQDVAAMLVEGTCPGLYTPEELVAIGNHLLPGGQVGQRRTENKMVAQERFLRRIRSNIHIVICAMHGSLNTIIKQYPSVLSRAACVDFYNEWTVEILKEVAERWLIAKGKNEFFYKVPWNLDERDRQLTAIYDVMANIHLSSRAALDKDFRRLGLEVFSPLKFVELIDMFRTLCNVICNEREDELSQLTRATDKVQEGKKYIEDTEKSISELTPLLEKARLDLKTADAEVKLATKKYVDSKEACADQQNEIEKLKIPLQRLKDEAKEQFGKVTPLYEAATATLQSLSIYVVEEVRSYRNPPDGVKFVTDTLCQMFGTEANWEAAKRLLIREHFFYDLLFYKKDEVSDWLFKRLEIYYKSENSNPNTLSSISQAAQLISEWIRTVYEYCHISRLLRPKQLEIIEAENMLKQARTLLGHLRVDSHHLKIELENAIEIYKDNLKETRSLEKQFQTLTRAKKKAVGLIESMNMYNCHWQERIDILKKKLETAPGDALLTSAIICYLSTFKDDKRDKLMREWMEYCKEGVDSEIPIDKEFSILNLLSSDEELIGWQRNSMPTDLFSLTNALVLRTTCIASKKCWPLLIDRNGQGGPIVKCLEEGMSNAAMLFDSSSSDRKGDIMKRTITSAIMNQKFSADMNQGRITAKSTRGNLCEASLLSEGFRREANEGRFSVYSSTDDRDSETTRTSDHSDSRTSIQRPYSSFSAITNESAFLKKFYVKTGLKDEPESLSASPLIELQEEILMVIEVDDTALDRKLKAAVANGLPTLVTHIERGIKSSLLASILGRSVSISDDGSCYLICDKKKLDYNPNFRLYLSAAVSMNFNKTNRFVLPLHKVLIVNMAVSEEGLTNKLIEMTIQSERPSLESPRRSLELDLFYLRQECKQIHDRVLNKIIEMPGKVLEEKSLPALMSDSKEQLRTTHERIKEGQQFKDDLENKRQGYYEVAYHGSMLYRVVSQITELESYYEIPLYFFAAIFKKTLKEAKRLKTEAGSVAARAAEINSQFTLDVYKRICLNVFKEHAPLYPILVTAFTLMRQKEINFEHYKMFFELCLMSCNENMTRSDSSISDEAYILTEEVQARVSALESLQDFTGLADSLRKHASEWKEYFETPPNLVSSCPCDFRNLGTFHKALIWLAVMPRKRTMTCQSLILCSLGPTFTEVERHDLDAIYKESTSISPVFVLLPEDGQNIFGEDPAIAIEAFGKSLKLQVITISLGLPQQLNEAVRAIKDAIKDDKKWVLLQNCDLESEWSQDFLRLIENITTTTDDESSCFNVEENPNATKRKKRFRLWMIFKCKEGLTFPIALVKKGLQIVWDEKIVTNRGSEQLPNRKITAQQALLDLYHNTLGRCETYRSTLPYFGTTAQLRYGKEVVRHLCTKAGQHRISNEKNQSFIPCILDEFVFGPAYTTSHAMANMSCKEDSKEKQNIASQGKGVERFHSERDFLRSAKAMITLVDDSRETSLEKVTNSILEEINSKIQLMHESLAKKTASRSLKSMNQFFYREIKFTREFCDMILQDLSGIQDSTDGGSSVLSAIKKGVVPDDWRSQLSLRSNRIGDWLQEMSTLCNSLQSHIRPKSRQPLGYDINLIPHPKGFFASLIEDFCNENLADIGNVELVAEVLQEKENLLPPIKGVYLKYITLKNTAWDYDQGQLRLEMMSVTQLPILHVIPQIRPKQFSKDGPTVVACPLVLFEGSEIAWFKMKSSFSQETVRIENIQLVSNSALY